MQIEKIINNNIISSVDENKVELVIMGKGIGFGKKFGDEIAEDKIEKIFRLDHMDDSERFKELIAGLPIEYIRLSNEIISYAKESVAVQLNQNVYLTLTDHISFAIERHRKGMEFANALSEEIKLFYPKEYMVGKHALYLIEEKTGCRLCEEEAASIALHIVNAEFNKAISTTFTITKMMHEMLEIIEKIIPAAGRASYPRDRLITNLKYLANRLISQEPIKGKEDRELYHFVRENCKREYVLIEELNRYIETTYQCSMTEEERIYLILQVKRIKDLYTI